MSMNIQIKGVRKVKYINKEGQWVDDIQHSPPVYTMQTSTAQTNQILESADPKQEYINIILNEFCREIVVPEYAEDDLFCEGEIIGYTTEDPAAEHILGFQEWCQWCENNGYEIKYEMI